MGSISGFEISLCEVLVERVRPGENQHVACEMQEHVHKEPEPRQSDEQLRADRRGEHTPKSRHHMHSTIRPIVPAAIEDPQGVPRPRLIRSTRPAHDCPARATFPRSGSMPLHGSRSSGATDPTNMKIHEYQAKAILARHGVPVPLGEMVVTADEAVAVATRLGGGTVVVKAQIHAGGRGKGGGVKVVKGPEEAGKAAFAMMGMRLVTHQTGPAGQIVAALARRAGSPNQARAVPGHRDRSLDGASGAHGQS